MPDFHDIDVEFAAPVTLIRPRARREQTVTARARTRIRIPDVSAANAPVTVHATETRERRPRVITRRRIGDAMVAPLFVLRVAHLWSDAGFPLDHFPEEMGNAEHSMHPLFHREEFAPWSRKDALKAEDVDGARILQDGRDRVMNLVHEAAKDLFVVEGRLMRKAPEPCLRLAFVPQRDILPYTFTEKGQLDNGFAFRLDRSEVVNALAAECTRAGFNPRAGEVRVDIDTLDLGALSLQEDRFNVREALTFALWGAGQCILNAPTEAVALLADFRRTHEALEAGPGDLAQAADLIERLAGAIPRNEETALFHMLAAMGLRAVEMSLPSPELQPFDDLDVEAMQGIAP